MFKVLDISEYDWPTLDFIKVRRTASSAMLIFNGKRGGEPARITLEQYQEAVDQSWLAEETEKTEGSETLITYQEGKGNKLVPIYFPPVVVAACKFLADKDVRATNKVSSIFVLIWSVNISF